MRLSNKVYDVLKWIAMYLLPALGTLYFALSEKYVVKDNGFGNKEGREGYSVPSSAQRFGSK